MLQTLHVCTVLSRNLNCRLEANSMEKKKMSKLNKKQFLKYSLAEQNRVEVRVKSQGECMEPVIKDGDVIEIYRKTPNELKVGDIIAFFDDKNNLVIHRVIGSHQSHNERYFLTKGDNFNRADGLIPENEVLGAVKPARDDKGKYNPYHSCLTRDLFDRVNIFVLEPKKSTSLERTEHLCSNFGFNLFLPVSLRVTPKCINDEKVNKYEKERISSYLEGMVPLCISQKGISNEENTIDFLKDYLIQKRTTAILSDVPDELTPKLRSKTIHLRFTPSLKMRMGFSEKISYFLGMLSSTYLIKHQGEA